MIFPRSSHSLVKKNAPVSKAVSDKAAIAVVGGGIAGATIALYLSEIGLKVSLFEKGPSLVVVPIDYRENMLLTERLGNIVCPI